MAALVLEKMGWWTVHENLLAECKQGDTGEGDATNQVNQELGLIFVMNLQQVCFQISTSNATQC